MVMIELAASEKPRPLPTPSFSAPFSSPTLQWAKKKRLRCSNALNVDNHSLNRRLASPSPDSHDHSSASLLSPSPVPSSPVPPHDWQKPPIRPRTPRKEDGLPEEEGERLTGKPAAATAGSSRVEAEPNENGEGRFLRSRAAGGGENCRKKKKVELWISLSREEIEEDYYSISGCRLPRRPKRRPRTTPPNLFDRIFPGSWLPNTITAEMYKVHELTEAKRV